VYAKKAAAIKSRRDRTTAQQRVSDFEAAMYATLNSNRIGNHPLNTDFEDVDLPLGYGGYMNCVPDDDEGVMVIAGYAVPGWRELFRAIDAAEAILSRAYTSTRAYYAALERLLPTVQHELRFRAQNGSGDDEKSSATKPRCGTSDGTDQDTSPPPPPPRKDRIYERSDQGQIEAKEDHSLDLGVMATRLKYEERWDPVRYAAEAGRQKHGFGAPRRFPFDTNTDEFFGVYRGMVRHPPVTMLRAMHGYADPSYAEIAAYEVLSNLLNEIGSCMRMWFRVRVANVQGVANGCAAALLSEERVLQALPTGVAEALSTDGPGRVRIMVRILPDNALGQKHAHSRWLENGSTVPAWDEGFGQLCDAHRHKRHMPLFEGQELLVKIAQGQDGKALMKGQKPLLIAEVWCLPNGLQPPMVTSCKNPSCPAYMDLGKAELRRWHEDVIPGWRAMSRGARAEDRVAISATIDTVIRAWPSTLLILMGLGDEARARGRMDIPESWRRADAISRWLSRAK
jgi:hypothetical protein